MESDLALRWQRSLQLVAFAAAENDNSATVCSVTRTTNSASSNVPICTPNALLPMRCLMKTNIVDAGTEQELQRCGDTVAESSVGRCVMPTFFSVATNAASSRGRIYLSLRLCPREPNNPEDPSTMHPCSLSKAETGHWQQSLQRS